MGHKEQATPTSCALAYPFGQFIASVGWTLLSIGRQMGIRAVASRGAKAGGELTVGRLPSGEGSQMSADVDIPNR